MGFRLAKPFLHAPTHQAILLDMTTSPKKTYTHPHHDQKCYTFLFLTLLNISKIIHANYNFKCCISHCMITISL